MSSRIRMVRSSTSASDTLMSPAITNPLSSTRSSTSTRPVARWWEGGRSRAMWQVTITHGLERRKIPQRAPKIDELRLSDLRKVLLTREARFGDRLNELARLAIAVDACGHVRLGDDPGQPPADIDDWHA